MNGRLLRSRTERLRFLDTIRTGLEGALIVTLILATIASYAVARTVTRPVSAITSAMRDVAATGDLTRKVSFRSGRWDDEDARLLASTFNTGVNGRTSFDDIVLQFKKQSGTDTIYDTLNRDTTGYLVVRTSVAESTAWTAAQKVRVYPVQCGEVSHVDPEENSLERYEVPLTVTAGATGDGFRASSSGPAWDAMVAAMSTAWGADTVEIATGGAIPLVKAMSLGVPDASMFVFGATDSFANIHGPNERVLVDEWQKATVAEAVFFGELARRWKGERGE